MNARRPFGRVDSFANNTIANGFTENLLWDGFLNNAIGNGFANNLVFDNLGRTAAGGNVGGRNFIANHIMYGSEAGRRLTRALVNTAITWYTHREERETEIVIRAVLNTAWAITGN